MVRVWGEIMGSPKCRNVGESQPVLMMINPVISPRTHSTERSGSVSSASSRLPNSMASTCAAPAAGSIGLEWPMGSEKSSSLPDAFL
jgi:hypothetical protein